MSQDIDTQVVETEEVPICPLCEEQKRTTLYTDVTDRVYGAPGEWTVQRCLNCSLVFLNPRPTIGDIGKIYASYYTHSPKKKSASLMQRVRQQIRDGYLALELGYDETTTRFQRLIGRLAYLYPEEQEVAKSSVMYLSSEHRGRVLEVGCGSGEALNELGRLGWEVEGVDFDEKAVAAARQHYNLDVKLGTLEEQEYPSDHFDALIMGHVIEHVHDPVPLLAECRRILKPGGHLIVVTPNIESLGHNLFGLSWLPLDPPRHLVLFSRTTLSKAAYKAGFSQANVKTTVRGAYGISIESHRISKNYPNVGQPPGSIQEKIRGHVYQYFEALAVRLSPGIGEELLMFAVK